MPDFQCLARNRILISRNEGRGENSKGVTSSIIMLLHNARKSLLKGSLLSWVLKCQTALTLYPFVLLSLHTECCFLAPRLALRLHSLVVWFINFSVKPGFEVSPCHVLVSYLPLQTLRFYISKTGMTTKLLWKLNILSFNNSCNTLSIMSSMFKMFHAIFLRLTQSIISLMVSLGDLSLAHWFSLYNFDRIYLSGVYLVKINIGSSPIRSGRRPWALVWTGLEVKP